MNTTPANSSGSDEITISTSSRCRAGNASNESPGLISRSISGQFLRKLSKTGNNHSKHAWHSIAICNRPPNPLINPAKSSSSASTWGNIFSANSNNLWPAFESFKGFDLRRNNSIPT